MSNPPGLTPELLAMAPGGKYDKRIAAVIWAAHHVGVQIPLNLWPTHHEGPSGGFWSVYDGPSFTDEQIDDVLAQSWGPQIALWAFLVQTYGHWIGFTHVGATLRENALELHALKDAVRGMMIDGDPARPEPGVHPTQMVAYLSMAYADKMGRHKRGVPPVEYRIPPP